MSLKALTYLGIRSDKLNDWSSFAGGLLGMQKIDKGGKSMCQTSLAKPLPLWDGKWARLDTRRHTQHHTQAGLWLWPECLHP